MAVPSLHFDNRIYVAMGTSFCVPSGKWSGAKTGSQGGDESGCPSDPRNPLTRLWQAGRDDGADHNGTFSQSLTDLKGSPCGVLLLWQSGGICGAMMR